MLYVGRAIIYRSPFGCTSIKGWVAHHFHFSRRFLWTWQFFDSTNNQSHRMVFPIYLIYSCFLILMQYNLKKFPFIFLQSISNVLAAVGNFASTQSNELKTLVQQNNDALTNIFGVREEKLYTV